MLSKPNRLRKNKEFNYIYKKGSVLGCEYFTVHYVDTYLKYPRFGFSISTKVGNSVVRSRVKRLLSEAVRKVIDSVKIKNYVITAKPEIVGKSLDEICFKLNKVLVRAKLLEDKNDKIV